MKHKASWSRMLGMAAVAATLGLSSVVLTGCSGGGNVLGGGGPVVNGNFVGVAANLGAGRTGTFALESRSDNTMEGTVTVVAPAAPLARISAAAVSLPPGVYPFQGTRNGNSFTGSGRYTGTPAFDFTVGGTLSTTANAGSWTISGSVNGEPFEFLGAINVTTGGGGGGGGNASFTFSNSGSNANTGSFSSAADVGTSYVVAGERFLNASFTDVTNPASPRIISITVTKSSAFVVGDTFGQAGRSVGYSEGAPPSKLWNSRGGTAKITAINGTNYTIELTNVAMEPTGFGLPGQVNNASGNFTINGSGTVVITAQ